MLLRVSKTSYDAHKLLVLASLIGVSGIYEVEFLMKSHLRIMLILGFFELGDTFLLSPELPLKIIVSLIRSSFVLTVDVNYYLTF